MKEILPRVLLNKEGDSALCLKASGSNSSAGLYRAIKADDHWANTASTTYRRSSVFSSGVVRVKPHEELICMTA